MTNFQTAADATAKAYDSLGSAEEENAKQSDTIKVKLQQLKAQFQELVLGDGGLNNFLKGLISLGTGILSVINNLGGLSTILGTVVGLLITFKGALVFDAIKKLGVNLSSLTTIIPRAISAWMLYAGAEATATTGAVTLGTAIQATIPIIGLLVAGGSLLIGVISSVNNKIEENKQKTLENVSALEKEVTSLNTLEDKINDENLSREELISLISDSDNSTVSAYAEEIKSLEDVNEIRQKAIDKIEEEKKAKAESLISTGFTSYKEAKEELSQEKEKYFNLYAGGSETGRQNLANIFAKNFDYSDLDDANFGGYTIEGIDVSSKNLQEYITSLQNTITEIQALGTATGNYDDELADLEAELTNAQQIQKDNSTITANFENALSEVGKKYNENTGQILEMTGAEKQSFELRKKSNSQTKQTYSSAVEASSAYDELAKSIGLSSDQLIKYSDDMEVSAEDYVKYQTQMNAFNSKMDEMQTTYSSLSDVVTDYNKDGEISIDNLQKLISMNPEYISLLQENNGKLEINKKALEKKVNIQNNAIKQQILETAQKRIDTVVEEDNAKAKEDNATATFSVSDYIVEHSKKIKTDSELTDENTKSNINNFISRNKNLKVTDEAKDKINKIVSETKNMLKFVDLTSVSLDKNTSSTKSNTSATKSNTKEKTKAEKVAEKLKKATNSLTKSLESQKDKLSDYTDEIKNLYSAIQDIYDEQIDDLEDSKDSVEDYYDNLTKKLEKEKSDYETNSKIKEQYYNDQIDLLDQEINTIDEKIKKLQEENEVIKDNNELQEKQEALASAMSKRVLVYKDGKFQYGQDEQSVQKAREDLEEYKRQKAYEDSISALEKEKSLVEDRKTALEEEYDRYKDFVSLELEAYDYRIDKIDEVKNDELDSYDKQIKKIQDMKDKVDEMANSWEKIASYQLIGNYLNGDVTNLKKLEKITKKYNSSLTEISNLETLIDKISKAKTLKQVQKIVSSGTIGTFASGNDYIDKDGIAIVGENPNKEIVIGSKLNNGVAMNLSKGSGVVNAKSTNTLASLLNNIPNERPTLSNNNQKTISNIFNITANVQDGEGLVDYLQDFSANMTQKSFS